MSAFDSDAPPPPPHLDSTIMELESRAKDGQRFDAMTILRFVATWRRDREEKSKLRIRIRELEAKLAEVEQLARRTGT